MTCVVADARSTKGGGSLKGEATRAAILEACARLFAQKGYDGTSLSEIAEAMGLTRPAVYHYFASKEAMLSSLVAETSELAADKLRSIRGDESLDSVSKLRAITAEIVQERLDFPERFRMLERSESALPGPIGDQHRAARRAVLAEVTGVVAEGILAGQFRSCDERVAALSVLGMCNWVAWWYRPGSADSPAAIIQEITTSAVAMLVQPDYQPHARRGPQAAIARLREDLDYLERVVDHRDASSASDGQAQ
jgi:AcrR family transcriptional regulator